MNAIYTERKPVFLVTSRLLAELATKDPNSDLEYSADKNGRYNPLNSTVYSDLIHHLSGIPADSITGEPNFTVLRDHATEKDAMIWSLSGDYLNDFFEAIPESKKSYEMLKKSADSFGKAAMTNQPSTEVPAQDSLPAAAPLKKEFDYYAQHQAELSERTAELSSIDRSVRTPEQSKELLYLEAYRTKLDRAAAALAAGKSQSIDLPTEAVRHGFKPEAVTGPATIDKEDLIALATENQAQGLVLELDKSIAWCGRKRRAILVSPQRAASAPTRARSCRRRELVP